MASVLDVLVDRGALLGALAGVALALLFHWLVPEGTDTVAAGAWFLGGGTAIGLFWSLLGRLIDRNDGE